MSASSEADQNFDMRRVFWQQRVAGLNLPIYLIAMLVVLTGVYSETLPSNIATGLAATMLIGAGLMWIGDKIPVFSSFGGGPLLCVIAPACLIYFSILPGSFAVLADDFYNEYGFAELAVTGLIVGSVLGMNRRLLMKAGVKFFIPLFCGLIFALGGAAIGGWVTGFGWQDALFYIGAPVMGGGMAAGAVPMADIYSQASADGNPGAHLAQLAPIVGVANVICILMAGGFNGLGKKGRFRKYSGEGNILRRGVNFDTDDKSKRPQFSAKSLFAGVSIALGIYTLGNVMYAIVPMIHMYVWVIVVAAALRIFNLVPDAVASGAENWYDFISRAWVPAILVAISAGMIDLNDVIEVVTDPGALGLTIFTVLVAVTVAGVVGVLLGFFLIEIAIAAGLGMADMGGSGDVAVLSASNRLQLMPFLQIASRIGGATTLLLISLLASWFM